MHPGVSQSAARTVFTYQSGDERLAAIAAGTLSAHHRLDVLVAVASNRGPGQLWALRALGDFSPAQLEAAVGAALSPALREALAPIWIQHKDWLRTEEYEGALQVLSDQRVRFDPANP